MKQLSDNQIAEELRPYGVSASAQLSDSIRTYISLLLSWNNKISLTTVTDPLEVVRFHFGESMFAASCVSTHEGRLADVGTGAGFPGLPLKLLAPKLSLFLIESSAKKAAFLSEVIRELKLDRVEVYRGRMEALPENEADFGFVSARALGMHRELLDWSRNRLSAGGKVLLWLGQGDATEIRRVPGWRWGEPIAIPRSERRLLVMGESL
jgi:16S rRNA (guanine527-N7)-methyltransferase